MTLHCKAINEGPWKVPSSSSDKIYTVQAFSQTEPPTCECVAYAISRNRAGGKNHAGIGDCPHIRKIIKTVCHWRAEDSDIRLYDTCPGCGGPVVDDDEQPDDGDVVASLVEMLRESCEA